MVIIKINEFIYIKHVSIVHQMIWRVSTNQGGQSNKPIKFKLFRNDAAAEIAVITKQTGFFNLKGV